MNYDTLVTFYPIRQVLVAQEKELEEINLQQHCIYMDMNKPTYNFYFGLLRISHRIENIGTM